MEVLGCGKRGCFWIVRLPFLYTVQLPHPYDSYIAHQFRTYLLLVSLALTVACSIASLGVWLFDGLRVKALLLAKPHSC